MSFLSEEKIKAIGFAYVGSNVKISGNAIFYGAERISIGNNTRIDDFCVISAGREGIEIGKYVHIAVYVSMQGQGKIILEDFAGVSSRVAIYSSNDDYSGNFMTGPCVPSKFTNVVHGPVVIGKHVIVGAGAAILPNITIGVGSAVGALSLVTKSIPEYSVAMGVPAKVIKRRERRLEDLEKQLLDELAKNENS
jgi:acetyltransferase-like isoleucine patch superfamily enzyme